MSFFRVLLLLVFSFNVQAEAENPPIHKPDTDNIKVYTKQSGDAVDALNKAVEVLRDPSKALASGEADKKAPPGPDSGNTGAVADNRPLPRDPTQMSGNFRQALKNLSVSSPNSANPNAAAPAHKIPEIELAGKMMGKNKSVMLRINANPRIFQVQEGKKISLVQNQQVITLRVDKIDKNQVKIFVLPFDAHLILQ